jgi:hypothetical protein
LAICNQQAKYYPVHFYRHQAGLSLEETIRFFEIEPVRSQGRKELINRLRTGWSVPSPSVSGEGKPAIRRREMLDKLQAKTVTEGDLIENLDRLLEAMRHLSPASCDLTYILGLLLRVLPKYGDMTGPQANLFRTAVAYLDETWYGKDDGLARFA